MSGQKLYIIRHAQVNVDPKISPEKWELSVEGMIATLKLATEVNWEHVQAIVHSPERKAEQTAKIIADYAGIHIRQHEDLRELRADIGFLPARDFHARVGAYLEGYPDPVFEDYQSAQKRIVQGVKQIVEQAEGSSVAIVSHGRILTVLYSYLLGRQLSVQEWKSIQLPDLSVLDAVTWQVEQGFLSE